MIRILIVDDQNIVRQGVRAILEVKPKLKVVGTASDGKSAIENAVALHPDVLIMDIEMPNIDGITATQKICQQLPEIKVLILSSHDRQDNIVQAIQAGANGYLLKNTLTKNLERAIWTVYHGQSYIESGLLKKVLTRDPTRVVAKESASFTAVAPARRKTSVKYNDSNVTDVTEKQSVPKIASNSNENLNRSADFDSRYLKNFSKWTSITSKTKLKPLVQQPELSNNSYDRTAKARLLIFSQSKNRWLIILGILGLLIASATIVYSFNFANRQTKVTATKETIKPAIEAITALGRIEPEGEVITLSPPPNMGGNKIDKLMVREGEQVKKGQVIALLDNHGLKKAAVETAQQEVEVAKVNLAIVKAGAKTGDIEAQKAAIESLEAELAGKIKTQKARIARLKAQLRRETEAQTANLARSQAELKNATSQFQRYQQLARDGAIAVSELDSRRLTLETAQERVREAQANYDRTRDTLVEEIKEAEATTEETQNTIRQQIQEAQASLASIAEVRPLDIQKAEAELKKAIANLKQAQQDLKLNYVQAPIASQVLRINARPGEMVTQDEGVAELGQTNRMVVVAEIYESDISQISLGQQAEIISEGGVFDDQLRGEVTHIRSLIGKKDIFDTDPAADVDTRVIEVKIMLDSSSSQKVSQFTNSKVIVKINRD